MTEAEHRAENAKLWSYIETLRAALEEALPEVQLPKPPPRRK